MGRFLHRLLQRSVLDERERAAVLHLNSHASQVAAHRDIVSPGEQIGKACLIVDGLAGRYDQMRDGRRQITTMHLPGDMCDLHSVIAPQAGWGVSALSTTTVLHVAHEELQAAVRRFPALGLAFWRDTTADASVLAKWVANLGRKDARARLAHLLCELGVRMEQAGIGARTRYRLEATQEQIADALGLTSVHVNRVLQSLRTEGVLFFHARLVEISDWERLADIAEFDPAFLLLGDQAEPPARAYA